MNDSTFLEQTIICGRQTLNEYESKQLLRNHGIPVVNETVVTSEAQALSVAKKTKYPVVLKALGETLTHKTERNLVRLNLVNAQAVKQAYRHIVREAGDELEGILVQPFIASRREFVAGLFRDPLFGPVIMFGMGGIFTEALADVSFRLAPLSRFDALCLLNEIRSKAVLKEFRGEAPVNLELLVKILLGLSQLASERPQIAEIDINPLVVQANGSVIAVDGLVVIDAEPAKVRSQSVPLVSSLQKFFNPKAIAFIGASSMFNKWGHLLPLSTLAGEFKGELYLVNPKGGKIFDRKVYETVTDIPGPVDLAVVTVPAEGVLELIPQLQAKKIKQMLLVTSGFRETGKTGELLEKELVAKARAAEILILGPNTMGVANPHANLSCLPFPVFPRAGSTALISQSGNMGLQFLAFAEQQGIGIRMFVGTGNEAMITLVDYLEACEQDPLTRIIMLYLESVREGRRLFEVAKRITRKKPIVLLKGGQSTAGKKAASSHTGAIASDSRIFNAACRQTGIIHVDRSRNLLDVAAAFASLPLPQGNRVAIMTLGGGWGVLTADLCQQAGLEIPELTPAIIRSIDTRLPSFWSKANPVDIVATFDMETPMSLMEELIRWDGCDALINLGILGKRFFVKRVADQALKFTPEATEELCAGAVNYAFELEQRFIELTVKLMETYRKPIIGVSLFDEGKDRTVYPIDSSPYKALFYPTPSRAVNSLSRLVEYDRFLKSTRS